MGWKGTLRSLAAADRRQQRATERQLNALGRLDRHVDRVVDRLDNELERDLEKVGKAELRIGRKPISAGGLTFSCEDMLWSFAPLSDQTGDFKWTITPQFTPDPVTLSSIAVRNGIRKMTAVSFAASRWGIVVAFSLEEMDNGKSPKKLVNKSDPNKSLVFLRTETGVHPAFDGDIDRQVGSGIGIIAFELPASVDVGNELTIEFHVEKPPLEVSITHDSLGLLIEKAHSGQTLVDLARDAFAKQVAPVRKEAQQQKTAIAAQAARAKSGGCGALLILAIVIALAVVVFR